MSIKAVLVVDDERFYAMNVVETLEEKYRVYYRRDINAAERALELHAEEIKAIVLDVMMPPPDDCDAVEAEKGLKTGLILLRRNREMLLERALPTLIYTNRLASTLEDDVAELEFPDDLLCVISKSLMSAKLLKHRIEEMIEMV